VPVEARDGSAPRRPSREEIRIRAARTEREPGPCAETTTRDDGTVPVSPAVSEIRCIRTFPAMPLRRSPVCPAFSACAHPLFSVDRTLAVS
jgi:hypothetical protein